MLSICNSFFCTMFFFASTGTRQIKPCLKMPLWYNWNVSLLLLRCCYTWLEYRTTLYYDDGGTLSTTFCIHCITVLYCDLMVWVFCFGWFYLQLLIDHNYTPREEYNVFDWSVSLSIHPSVGPAFFVPYVLYQVILCIWCITCHWLCLLLSSNRGVWGLWDSSLFLSFYKYLIVQISLKSFMSFQ